MQHRALDHNTTNIATPQTGRNAGVASTAGPYASNTSECLLLRQGIVYQAQELHPKGRLIELPRAGSTRFPGNLGFTNTSRPCTGYARNGTIRPSILFRGREATRFEGLQLTLCSYPEEIESRRFLSWSRTRYRSNSCHPWPLRPVMPAALR